MKHIGLIGGIGPAATDHYHRGLIKAFGDQANRLDLSIVYAHSGTLIENMGYGDASGQAEIFRRLTQRLEKAGADMVAVTSIAGHFPIQEFKDVSPLPVVDLLSSVNQHLIDNKYHTVGVLGTRGAMETGLYERMGEVAVMPPPDMEAVHDAYIQVAMTGKVTSAQRRVFYTAGLEMTMGGAQAIMLGGTDLVLAFKPRSRTGFKVIGCAQIHIDDIAKKAMA